MNRIEGGWTGSIDLTIANPIGEAGSIADDPASADLGVLDGGRFVVDGNSVRYDGPMLKQPANDGANRHRSRSGTAW